jgi:uncharacterized protein YqiB (DUF1249 family)
MSTTTVYQANFTNLLEICPDLGTLTIGDALRFEAGPAFMPLTLDVLDQKGSCFRIALAHYFEMNGDLVPDPDMELWVDLRQRSVEALTFQDYRSYQEIYPGAPNSPLKTSLNSFLAIWLSNIKQQGFRVVHSER